MASYLISSWCHSFNCIDIWRPVDIRPLLYFCFMIAESQKCEWKTLNTEETENTVKKIGISIWKHDIGFLNFLRLITFTILTAFKNFVIITLPNLGLRKMYDVCFQTLVSFSNCWVTCSCFYKLWVSSFNSPLDFE